MYQSHILISKFTDFNLTFEIYYLSVYVCAVSESAETIDGNHGANEQFERCETRIIGRRDQLYKARRDK